MKILSPLFLADFGKAFLRPLRSIWFSHIACLSFPYPPSVTPSSSLFPTFAIKLFHPLLSFYES